jgi:hypothetical protein
LPLVVDRIVASLAKFGIVSCAVAIVADDGYAPAGDAGRPRLAPDRLRDVDKRGIYAIHCAVEFVRDY